MASSSAAGDGGQLGDHGSWDYRRQQAAEPADESAKQYAPAALRNEAPILAVLTEQLGQTATKDGDDEGCLIEVGCGTGQHAAAFSRALIATSNLLAGYLPTDLTDGAFASVRAHTATIAGVLPPRVLDVRSPAERWFSNDGGLTLPPLPARAILAINITHISPWDATLGLLRGAAAHLHPDRGLLMVYGPFTRRGGQHSGDGGNERFDATLRAQDPEWGYRDVEEEVVPAAERAGLELVEVVDMPSNNLMLVMRRRRRKAAM